MPEPTVAIVTGATGSIGSAVVAELLSAGVCVFAVAREFKSLEALCGRFAGDVTADKWVRCFASDVSERKGAELVAREASAMGRIDLAVNVVGWSPFRKAIETEDWVLDKVFRSNVYTAFNMSVAAIPHMRGGGSIINVSSSLASRLQRGRAVYGAAKAAVEYLTRALAAEVGELGIAVNCVAPGVVLTEEVKQLLASGAEEVAGLQDATVTGSLVTPEDLARVIVDLAFQPRNLVTGQVWGVDAGWSLL